MRFICEGDEPRRPRGRPRIEKDRLQTSTDSMRKKRTPRTQMKQRCVAVLDMETDPFDSMAQSEILPFCAYLYSDQFEPVLIWEEDFPTFCRKLVEAIEALPDEFTIYAHNGGRFDFMFLIKHLRGKISFKGRGIMSAKIGNHELRDSFHIIPEKLAAYQKQAFDYSKLTKKNRKKNRAEIIDYLKSDCLHLFDIVKKFVEGFGLKMSIGQAAMVELKKYYEVEKFSDGWDNYVRQYFFGGRVECIRGRGEFIGDYKIFDVNSLYPSVMANFSHPIGEMGHYKLRHGEPTADTYFIDLDCTNNGALIGRGEDGETTARIKQGRFRTTIHEYRVALKYGLIDNVSINYCLDCEKATAFDKFVLPLYENRLRTKAELDRMKKAGTENSAAFLDMKKDDIFYKLLLNNAYGKFAQNPRRFKEHWITDPDELPPDEWFNSVNKIPDANERTQYLMPHYEAPDYWIWSKPAPSWRFNNVGTAASITGAARSVLLEALQDASDPIYCDTDSIICRDLKGVLIDKVLLGAWDLEDEFSRVIIDGKKLYSVMHKKAKNRSAEDLERGISPNYTVKSKGASGLTWDNMLAMLEGGTVSVPNKAPTLTKYGKQYYLTRNIKATAEQFEGLT